MASSSGKSMNFLVWALILTLPLCTELVTYMCLVFRYLSFHVGPQKKHNTQALKSRQFYYPPLTVEGSYYCKYNMYLCCKKISWCKSGFFFKMCSQESLTWCGRVQTKNTKRNPDFTPVTAWIFLGTKKPRKHIQWLSKNRLLKTWGGRADGSHKKQLHDLVHLSPLNLWV